MRRRPSARLLVVDKDERVLLFRFVNRQGPLGGQDFWATPGGGVEAGESIEQAGIRELWEETGLRAESLGPQIAQREFVLRLADGERVIAEEHFFLVEVEELAVSRVGWTELEVETMLEHRWWSLDELAKTSATIWPDDLVSLLKTS